MDKERYNNDPIYRDHIKEIVKKYQQSEKGKARIREAVIRRRQENPRYLANYLRERRAKAKKAGVCTRCYKKPVIPNKVICSECKEKENQRMIEYRKKNPQVMRAVNKRKRDRAKRLNICTQCFKNVPVKGKTKCQSCLDRLKKYVTSHK